jgi:hypothetical protein
MTSEDTRKQLDKIMFGIPAFKKSTRGRWLYNAMDVNNKKVKVQFDGHNFRVMVGDLETLIASTPLSKLPLANVEKYLIGILNR